MVMSRLQRIQAAGGNIADAVKSGNVSKYTETISNRSGKRITTMSNSQVLSNVSAGSPVSTIPNITPGVDTSILGQIKEEKTMVSAGQDLTMYQKVDSMLGGILPGGVEPQPGAVATALRVAGASAATAAVVGVGYGAYKYFTKDGKERKTKANGQPYKRPSMNYANPKALGRAERRLSSFIKHSRKHVSAMGYTITRKHIGGK